jgi:hypothetical protein
MGRASLVASEGVKEGVNGGIPAFGVGVGVGAAVTLAREDHTCDRPTQGGGLWSRLGQPCQGEVEPGQAPLRVALGVEPGGVGQALLVVGHHR